MSDKSTALVPQEGWHCLHLFYRIEYGQWQLFSREEQNAAKTNLSSLVQEVRAMDSTQLLTFGVVTPKADRYRHPHQVIDRVRGFSYR